MTKKKIAELNLDLEDKRMLGLLATPKKAALIAGKLRIGYSTAHQKLSILEALGYVKKIKTMTGKTLYELKNVEL